MIPGISPPGRMVGRGGTPVPTPTDITLTSQTVAETSADAVAANTVIGTLGASGGTAPYTFSIQAGGTQFDISGTSLRAKSGNTLTNGGSPYSVTVRVTDANTLTYDEVFSITVTDYVSGGDPGGTADIAEFVVEGTGAASGTIIEWGHAFPEGVIWSDSKLRLVRGDTSAELLTTIHPRTLWPDGSVRTAGLMTEMNTLADTSTVTCTLRRSDAYSAYGSNLNLATAISGREASVTVTPETGSAWTYDILANVGSTHWRHSELGCQTRVESAVPSANADGATGVRLVADLFVTKDGNLEVDASLRNDAVQKTGGAKARMRWSISIDSAARYTSNQDYHTGSAGRRVELLQYAWWWKRRGRHSGGAMATRPYIRPNIGLLDESKVTFLYDTNTTPASAQFTEMDSIISTHDALDANPYDTYGMTRDEGATGGRPEIGFRSNFCWLWMVTGDRRAQKAAQRMAEANMTRALSFWDDGESRWLTPNRWPWWEVRGAGASADGTDRSVAYGPPTGQGIQHNTTDHISGGSSIDVAHSGSHNQMVGLLTDRRQAYDGMAAEASAIVLAYNDRTNGTDISYPSGWQAVTPSVATGACWGPRWATAQVRHVAWGSRHATDAASLLPDDWPNRSDFEDCAQARINAMWQGVSYMIANHPYGELATPYIQDSAPGPSGLMWAYLLICCVHAQRTGVGGSNIDDLLTEFARCAGNAMTHPDFNWKNYAAGEGWYTQNGTDPDDPLTTWAASQTLYATNLGDTGNDFRNTGNWQRLTFGHLLMMYEATLPDAVMANIADGVVKYWSQRPSSGNPTVATPSNFFQGAEPQTNALVPTGVVLAHDVAPEIRGGQSFSLASGASNGTAFGVIRWDGGIPRASANEGTNAFVEVSGLPSGVTLGRGGQLTKTGSVTPGSYTLNVYATTYDNSGTETRGSTVAVSITVT